MIIWKPIAAMHAQDGKAVNTGKVLAKALKKKRGAETIRPSECSHVRYADAINYPLWHRILACLQGEQAVA